ncbi:MAG: putative sulfate exporter family transporter [Pseudomonadota bacterium]
MASAWRLTRLTVPGFALAALVSLLAWATDARLGGSVMLYALLFGMLLNFLVARPAIAPGVAFTARPVLRLGVALLGARLTLVDVHALGAATVTMVVLGVVVTLVGGVLIGQMLGIGKRFSVLTAGAVAICGASAALAIAAVLPVQKDSERQTILAVAGVTTLSTVAMMTYPLLVGALGMDDGNAGVFLGASIHDVAQVVGAGYTVSEAAGETATLVKLMRVACLVPVVAVLSWLVARHSEPGDDGGPVPGLPLFLVAFVLLMLANTFGLIPTALQHAMTVAARFCLVLAVAARGIKTSMQSLLAVGPRPVAAMVLQTLLLAVFVMVALQFVLPLL